jgi:methyl-accepting chemotaxis protein
MRFLRWFDEALNVKGKVIINVLIGMLLTFGILIYQVALQNTEDLKNEAFSKLELARDIKKVQIQTYFKRVDTNIKTLTKAQPLRSFIMEFLNLDDYDDLEIDAKERFPVENQYIINMSERKDEFFKMSANSYGLEDIYIIDKEHGHIMYSMAKNKEHGENLIHGNLKNSHLAKLYKDVKVQKKTVFSDISLFKPTNRPEMFVATPIIIDNTFEAVLAFRLDLKDINIIMQERSGMGKSGETYLVGQDYLMRSNSFIDPTNHSVKASMTNPKLGICKTKAVIDALKGQTQSKIVIDYNGNPVLSSFSSFSIGKFKWAILAEIDEAEIMEKIDHLIKKTIISALIIFVVILGIMYFSIGFTIRRNVNDPINRAVNGLLNSTENIDKSSHSMAQKAMNLSDMSASQSASVEQITATVEETSTNANMNVSNMKELVNFGRNMELNTNQGYKHMVELKESMHGISESSKSINSLVNTIDEIAFQTNLLALNAAVEAARAGEHGLGFAVVADEVRNLSQRSTNEAVKIHQVIEKSVVQAQAGVEIANKTNSSFEIILENIHASAIVREQTLISSQEQQTAIEQLRRAMIEVDTVTQQLAVDSEQISEMADDLNYQTSTTNQIVNDINRMV